MFVSKSSRAWPLAALLVGVAVGAPVQAAPATTEARLLEVKGDSVKLDKGYVRIERTWKRGDTINVDLPMPVRRVISNAKVVTNRGKVALERGPIVFCLEGQDNDGKVHDLVIPDDAELTVETRPDLLGVLEKLNAKMGRSAE